MLGKGCVNVMLVWSTELVFSKMTLYIQHVDLTGEGFFYQSTCTISSFECFFLFPGWNLQNMQFFLYKKKNYGSK